ncbi:MAG: 5'/3'-nucleotidase SurE [Candidatus Heimdallarchaeota archaeon]|nr:5'/3'-nucleotidase SurE [Candidatus Heimdallarchaeota archaeon]
MRILLTNDDGVYAEGLIALYEKLKDKFDVTVCAPESEQSAVGHAITLTKPLRIKKVSRNGSMYAYAVTGTPADCVKVAIRSILKQTPDLVISGINHGPNLGSDIMYSGTVAAATESAILGIPSMAVSLAAYENLKFNFAAEIALKLARNVIKSGLPNGVLLNINVPAIEKSKVRGSLVTCQGQSLYKEAFLKRVDPRGRIYYWLSGKVHWRKKSEGSDIKAIEDNYVSITPLQFDLTSHKYLKDLKTIFKNNVK